jgi:hypothetical protein
MAATPGNNGTTDKNHASIVSKYLRLTFVEI